MRGFIAGFLLGSFLFGGMVSYAGAKIIGSGELTGIEVVDGSGNTICTDPYFWSATKEIECSD
jgi:hypothetical protein